MTVRAATLLAAALACAGCGDGCGPAAPATEKRQRTPGSATELHQAPPPIFTAAPARGDAEPTGEPLPESARGRYVASVGRGRLELTLDERGAFRAAFACPGRPDAQLLGRAYRARAGAGLPGLGRGPSALIVPLASDGKLQLSSAALARDSALTDGCTLAPPPH